MNGLTLWDQCYNLQVNLPASWRIMGCTLGWFWGNSDPKSWCIGFLGVGSQRQGTPWEPGLSLEKNIGIRSRREDWESEIHDWKEKVKQHLSSPNGGVIYTIAQSVKKFTKKKQTFKRPDPNKKNLPFICHIFNGGKPKLPNCCFPQLQLLSLVC